MNMKNILHNISDNSDAEQSNLWYSIEDQMKEENLMRKSKNRRLRFNLTIIAALMGIIVIGSIAFGRNIPPIYHQVTLSELESIATPLNLSATHQDMTVVVDWAYADVNQVVLAYTLFDSEGNALTGEELEDGSVELHIFWDEGNDIPYSGHGLELLVSHPESTQQIARFFNISTMFDIIKQQSDGEYDLRQLISLNMRAVISIGSSDESLKVFRPTFEVPFSVADFEQHNNFIDFDEEYFRFSSPPVDEVEVYFNDLTITRSVTSAIICVQLPPDAGAGLYFPVNVRLFVDGRLVKENTISDQYKIFETQAHFYHDVGVNRANCEQFNWHIAFDVMPETIRVEIGEFHYALADYDDESAELYQELFSESGFDISYTRDEETSELSIEYPDSWWEIGHTTRYAIAKRIMETMYEEYEIEADYTDGWEYIFNIVEEEVVILPPLYHPVNIAEIESMATPLNLTQTQGDITIQLDWVYADASQIVLAYTPYDADGEVIEGDDFDTTLIELEHHFDDDIKTYRQVSIGEGSQQILRYRFSTFSFELSEQYTEIDPREFPIRNLRANFFPGVSADWWRNSNFTEMTPTYVFDFEVPFESIQFEQHNEVFDLDAFINSEEVVSDFEVYFNDLVITDSATAIFICIKIPADVHYGIYFPREVNLYADSHFIGTADLSHEDVNIIRRNSTYHLNNSDILFDSSYIHRTPYTSYCAEFTWHMRFDELPSNIRIEIPELRPVTSQYFVNEGEMQTYITLFAGEGYDLTYSSNYRDLAFHYDLEYPGAFNTLDETTKEEIFERVWNAFDEIYPRDERYTRGWEYTFEINSD